VKKIRINLYSLAGCEGCATQLINVFTTRPDLLRYVEFKHYRLIGLKADIPVKGGIAVIEGSAMSKHHEELLIKIRKNSELVIAIGSCALLGGVQALIGKSNANLMRMLKEVYGSRIPKIIELEKPKPITDIIKVDIKVPGCPVELNEIEKLLVDLVSGALPRIRQRTVCLECKLRENECLLDKGVLCLGPLAVGGCGAKCPTLGAPCYGCRGLFEDYDLKEFINILMEKGFNINDVKRRLLIFMGKVVSEIESNSH